MAKPVLKLRVICPGQADQILAVEGPEILIGRAAGCDVVIPDRHISARHARLLSGPVVIDLESTNGTFVDGARVVETCALTGGVVHLGSEEGDIRIELLDDSSPDLDATLAISSKRVSKDEDGQALKTDPLLAADSVDNRREPEPSSQLVNELTAELIKRDQELSEASRDRSRLAELVEVEKRLSSQLRDRVAALENERVEMLSALEEARAAENGNLPLLRSLLEQDFVNRPADPEWAPSRFVTYELLRFLLAVDRALEFRAEPGLVAILSQLFASPEMTAPRRQMSEHLKGLRSELETGLRVFPAAAARFIGQLKDDLSAGGLTRTEPIPALKQLSGQVEEELWLRASRYLEELTLDGAEARIRELARQLAAGG